jgi:hypothetical protein
MESRHLPIFFSSFLAGMIIENSIFDAFAKTHGMAKQKFRPTRLGGFSGTKAYI